MTTSFTLNVDSCIEEAIRFSGGQPSQFEELQSARNNLNLLFSEWTTQGVNLWKIDFVDVTIPASVVDVSLSGDIVRPLHIATQYGVSVSGTNASDLGMIPITYIDYNKLPQKMQYGRPTQYLAQRQLDQITLKLWPVPAQETILKMCVLKRFDDVNRPTDGLDAPFRFLPALTYGLAYRLGMQRAAAAQPGEMEAWEAKLNRLDKEYTRTWTMAFNEDTDNTPLQIVPQRSR